MSHAGQNARACNVDEIIFAVDQTDIDGFYFAAGNDVEKIFRVEFEMCGEVVARSRTDNSDGQVDKQINRRVECAVAAGGNNSFGAKNFDAFDEIGIVIGARAIYR